MNNDKLTDEILKLSRELATNSAITSTILDKVTKIEQKIENFNYDRCQDHRKLIEDVITRITKVEENAIENRGIKKSIFYGYKAIMAIGGLITALISYIIKLKIGS